MKDSDLSESNLHMDGQLIVIDLSQVEVQVLDPLQLLHGPILESRFVRRFKDTENSLPFLWTGGQSA